MLRFMNGSFRPHVLSNQTVRKNRLVAHIFRIFLDLKSAAKHAPKRRISLKYS